MGKEEQFIQDKASLERILTLVRKEFVTHLVRAHNGVPMTTCHQCMNHRQRIVVIQEIISELDLTQQQLDQNTIRFGSS
jgi:hypothetical protein